MINVCQSQLFVRLVLPRRGAVWCCAIRCHYGPHKRRPKHEPASSHLQTITPASKQVRHLQGLCHTRVPSPICTPCPPHHVPLQLLFQHNTTWRKGQMPYSKNLLLFSFHFMKLQLTDSIAPWKTPLWGASWRAKRPCWAWCLSSEQISHQMGCMVGRIWRQLTNIYCRIGFLCPLLPFVIFIAWLVCSFLLTEFFPVKFVAITPGEGRSDGDLDLWGSNSSGKERCSHICQVNSADAKIMGEKKTPYWLMVAAGSQSNCNYGVSYIPNLPGLDIMVFYIWTAGSRAAMS